MSKITSKIINFVFEKVTSVATYLEGKVSSTALNPPTDKNTLGYAKRYVGQFFDKGEPVQCPCCTQKVKQYPRKITSVMAHQLYILYLNKNRWIGGKELQETVDGSNRNYSLLRFWDLIEPGKDSTWRITHHGIDFVQGYTVVPERAFVYNNCVVGFSENTVAFRDVRDDGFVGQEYLDDLLDPVTVIENQA